MEGQGWQCQKLASVGEEHLPGISLPDAAHISAIPLFWIPLSLWRARQTQTQKEATVPLLACLVPLQEMKGGLHSS